MSDVYRQSATTRRQMVGKWFLMTKRSHSGIWNETFWYGLGLWIYREARWGEGDYLGKFNKMVTVAPKMARRMVKRIPMSQRKDFCM